MIGRLRAWVPWVALGAVLAGPAWLIVSTSFMLYDDEGYVLLSLRQFLAGHALYDELFTQYGPFPYAYHLLVTGLLDLPMTHVVGRALTTLHWVACSVLAGLAARHVTERLSVGLATAGIAFALLWQMALEPNHPGSLIAVLVAVGGWLACRWPAARRPAGIAATLGALGAALLLTKINIGVLFCSSVGVILLLGTAWPDRLAVAARVAAWMGLLALPWGLMQAQLGQPAMLFFAVQFTLAAAGLLWVQPVAPAALPLRCTHAVVIAFGLTLAAVAVVPLLRGTSLAALIGAVLLDPLRHPANFIFPFPWEVRTGWLAAVAWTLTAAAGWHLRRHGDLGRTLRALVVSARLAAFALFLFKLPTWPTIHTLWDYFGVCLPLVPLFVVPLRSPEASRALFPLAIVALPQVLHAYPVAGSQVGWGSFLLLPVFAAGIAEAWSVLADASAPRVARVIRAGFAGLLAAAALFVVFLLAREGWQRHTGSQPLGLPGAETIRPGGEARITLRTLTLNAQVHADVLFSRPGMYSYNLWSGADTPTLRNATHWSWLLNAAEQRAVVQRLEATPRRAIITNRRLDEFMVRYKVPLDGPIQSHLLAGYRPLFSMGDFEFLVPRDSQAVPFGQIALQGRDDAPAASGHQPIMLQANLVLTGTPASYALEAIEAPWNTLLDFPAAGTRGYLEPITREGRVFGPAVPLPLRQPVNGLFRLTLFHDAAPPLRYGSTMVLVVRDGAGRVLAEASFFSSGDDAPPGAN
jgi:hypothetical protein